MGHIQTIEQELRALLAEGDTEKTVSWVKDKVLESYRNGLKGRKEAGKKGAKRTSRKDAEN